MNEEDLRRELDALAGPLQFPTATDRSRVRARVERTRRRSRTVAGAVVAMFALGGIAAAFAVAPGRSGRPVDIAVAPSCRVLPPVVARREVPAAVRRWAGRQPVVGRGSLWSTRRVLAAAGEHDGSVVRLKLGWFVLPAGPGATPPVLAARQLGGSGRAVGSAGAATDSHGTWFASTIELPATGSCWQITARHGRDVITFRRAAA